MHTQAGRLPKVSDVRVAVTGEILLDQYSEGAHTFTSKENVAAIKINRSRCFPGNAANVANNVCAMGARSRLIGVIGSDAEGDRLLAGLHSDVDADAVLRDESRETSVKFRIQENGRTLLRIDRDDHQPITPAMQRKLLSLWNGIAESADAFIFSDLGKGLYSPKLIQAFVAAARKFGTPVLVDPAGGAPEAYRGANALFPNLHEFNQLVRQNFQSAADAVVEARYFLKHFDIPVMVLKDSAAGSYYIDRDRTIHSPAGCVEVQCEIGAGDSFIAAFAVSIANGCDPADAFLQGSIASAVAVSKPYTAAVTWDEINEFVPASAAGDGQREGCGPTWICSSRS